MANRTNMVDVDVLVARASESRKFIRQAKFAYADRIATFALKFMEETSMAAHAAGETDLSAADLNKAIREKGRQLLFKYFPEGDER